MFNGYQDQVASLYTADLKKYYEADRSVSRFSPSSGSKSQSFFFLPRATSLLVGESAHRQFGPKSAETLQHTTGD
jgi:hypothetical protein